MKKNCIIILFSKLGSQLYLLLVILLPVHDCIKLFQRFQRFPRALEPNRYDKGVSGLERLRCAIHSNQACSSLDQNAKLFGIDLFKAPFTGCAGPDADMKPFGEGIRVQVIDHGLWCTGDDVGRCIFTLGAVIVWQPDDFTVW